jgi:hypothetical protein
VRAALVVLAGTALAAGCNKPDEIQKYKVERVEDRVRPFVPPTYQVPEGWTSQGRGKAQFAVFKETFASADKQTQISVTALTNRIPLLMDVNRWRGEVDLPETKELPKDIEKITVEQKECDYVDLTGPAKRTLVVILPRDAHVWYFRATGPKDAVAKEKPAFEKFVRSVSFPDE